MHAQSDRSIGMVDGLGCGLHCELVSTKMPIALDLTVITSTVSTVMTSQCIPITGSLEKGHPGSQFSNLTCLLGSVFDDEYSIFI